MNGNESLTFPSISFQGGILAVSFREAFSYRVVQDHSALGNIFTYAPPPRGSRPDPSNSVRNGATCSGKWLVQQGEKPNQAKVGGTNTAH